MTEPECLPVFGGVVEQGRATIFDLYGTSFPIGGPLLLTASHSARNAQVEGRRLMVGHGQPKEHGTFGPFQVSEAVVFADFPDVDLCVLNIAELDYRPLNWDSRILLPLSEVNTLGYAFGLDQKERRVVNRGFFGHVVATRPFETLAGAPAVYEVSFQAPRGLSGAPLFLRDAVTVCGCVTGNWTTRMMVFSDSEVLTEASGRTMVERYEALNLGIAIRADAILGLRLPDGVSLRDYALNKGARIE